MIMKPFAIILVVIFLCYPQTSRTDKNATFDNKMWHQYESTKLAKVYYDNMYSKWDLLIFKNLSHCEKEHMETLLELIEDYSNPRLFAVLENNKFNFPELNESYSKFMNQGNQSLIAALEEAAFIEENTVKDLQNLIELSNEQFLAEELYEILTISRCHLQRVVCHLDHRDVVYKPKVLSVYEYLDCLNYEANNPKCPYDKTTCPYKKHMEIEQ